MLLLRLAIQLSKNELRSTANVHVQLCLPYMVQASQMTLYR